MNRYLDFEEYNDFEKKLDKRFNNENSMFDFVVLINYDEERIGFFRPKDKEIISKEDDSSVPFAIIEDVPIYPGCEGTKEELRLCLQDKITQHVSQNFNSDLANSLGLETGTKRIFVMFKIDKNGNITEAKARAPHQSLADEALRVINSLPQMIPGKQDGENVSVKYSLPIAFNVD